MASRLEIFSQLLRFCAERNVRLQRFWAAFVETTRYKLGESIKDLKIPFSLDSESADALEKGVADLMELLKRRHEAAFKEPTDHSIDDVVGGLRLPPRAFSMRVFRRDSLEAKAAEAILLQDPLFDAGVLELWLGAKGTGRTLLTVLQGVIQKSLAEEVRADHLEKTAYLAYLSLLKHAQHAKGSIKQRSIKGISYEQIDVAFGLALATCFRVVIEAIQTALQSKKGVSQADHSLLLMSSATYPLLFTSIKSSILKQRFNPYGIPQEVVDLLDPLYRSISQENTDLTFVGERMNREILRNSAMKQTVVGEALLQRIRNQVVTYLFDHDHSSFRLGLDLRDLISNQTSLFDLVSSSRSLGDLAEALKNTVKAEATERRGQDLTSLEEVIRLTQKGQILKKSPWPEDLTREMVERYLAFKIDLFIDPYLTEAISLLDNRLLKFGISQLKQDYESGRLYRISADAKPILHEFLERTEGQLFIDLKDFTKRTHFSKEIAMAEFLGNEFYKPILDAAKRYETDPAHAGKSISLVNLLGDAVIFSGNIESLVYLAQDIQNLFKNYRGKLKASSPSSLAQDLKTRLEARYQNSTNQIQAALRTHRERHSALRAEMSKRAQASLKDWATRLPHDLGQEITRAEGEFLAADASLNKETDPQRRAGISAAKSGQLQMLTKLRGLQKTFSTEFRQFSADQQRQFLQNFYCRDLLLECEAIEETIENLQKRESNARFDYERDLRRIEGFGMDAGLFISYGSAAEVVQLRDPIWGDLQVYIAESINESARGTARNPFIKKMLEARLAEQTRLRGKPDLSYPYNVFVEKTYSFQLAPRKNAELHGALKNANSSQAEQILQNMHYDSVQDIRDYLRNPSGNEERRSLAIVRDIYNEGEAISEEALNAFLRETATSRYNIKRSFPVRKFHQQILENFLFLTDSFQFVLSLSHQSPKQDPLIFRYAGEVTFRGFEGKGETTVYELLKFDSPFYQMMLRYHFSEWLREFDASLVS